MPLWSDATSGLKVALRATTSAAHEFRFRHSHRPPRDRLIKYDRRPELDPFWVADMDFASAPAILAALHRRVDHGVFGYAQPHEGLDEAVIAYLRERRGA